MSLLLGVGVSGFSGILTMAVTQPAVAAVGTEQDFLTGTAIVTVPQPVLAAAGMLRFTGMLGMTVLPPVVATSGLVTISITGTLASTIPPPTLSGMGIVPITLVPAASPRRHPVRFRRLTIRGMLAMAVSAPRIRAPGAVLDPWEAEIDMTAVLVYEDDTDLLLATVDAWMN